MGSPTADRTGVWIRCGTRSVSPGTARTGCTRPWPSRQRSWCDFTSTRPVTTGLSQARPNTPAPARQPSVSRRCVWLTHWRPAEMRHRCDDKAEKTSNSLSQRAGLGSDLRPDPLSQPDPRYIRHDHEENQVLLDDELFLIAHDDHG